MIDESKTGYGNDDDDDEVGLRATNNDNQFKSASASLMAFDTKIEPYMVFFESKVHEIEIPRIPVITVLILLVSWFSFLYGVYGIIGIDNTHLSLSGPTSPPNEYLIFKMVNIWPDCQDARLEIWRLFSFQLVHHGLNHIIGNSVALLIHGSFLENLCYNRLSSILVTLTAFEGGILFGAIGFSFIFPYSSLIGMSCGVYSIIGAVIALVYDNSNNYLLKRLLIGVVVIIQLSIELILYFVSYNPNVGYSSHFFGFLFGILFGLSTVLVTDSSNHRNEMKRSKRIIGWISICFFITFSILMLYDYGKKFPPNIISWNPTIHSNSVYNPLMCCGEAYEMMGHQNPKSFIEEISNIYDCVNDNLIIRSS